MRGKIIAADPGRFLFPGSCPGGSPAKLVFVRGRRKKDWLTLISTSLSLSNEDIVRIYGKRWDIEVFFKMAKQHLKLAKEIQCRDYDALVAHTSIVFMRYMFLAYQNRIKTDNRTFDELFYACCDEVSDISFVESLYRIMTLAGQGKIRIIGHGFAPVKADGLYLALGRIQAHLGQGIVITVADPF